MMPIDQSKPVLVTGGSGYIASWIVKYLLEQGMAVRATVRDANQRQKVRHLTQMGAQFPGKLELITADLLDPGAFDRAAQGCELVLHTASPWLISGYKDAANAFIKPALEGTRNVLKAVNGSQTVKRVVLTSSVAAICGDAADFVAGGKPALTEADWNTTSSETHQPYSYSKTIAEKDAWRICKRQQRWDLVAINPSMVFGPSLTTGTISGSVSLMKQFGDGTARFGVPDLSLGMVDVRDVAQAHLNAGFTAEASGRHILSAGEMNLLEIGRILEDHFGSKFPFPKRVSPKFIIWLTAPLFGLTRPFVSKNIGYRIRYDNTCGKTRLGMTYRPKNETIIAHFQQLIDDGLIKNRA